MVIESMHEKTEEAMCKLLQALFRSFIISIDQMKNVSSSEILCQTLAQPVDTFAGF